MKRILTILFLLISFAANAAIATVVTQASQFGGSGGTTSSINTTGSSLIVVVITYRQGGGVGLSDSKGNTWTQCTKYEGSGSQAGVVAYYCNNGTFGTSHTFTTTATYCGVCVIALSGTRTASTPKDQENGQWISSLGTTATPGSITPSVNNCIVITGCMNYGGSTPTVPSGYTSVGTWTTATAYAGGVAYKIQTTAGAENPSWANMNSGNNGSVNVISFFEPAATPTTNAAFFYNLIK